MNTSQFIATLRKQGVIYLYDGYLKVGAKIDYINHKNYLCWSSTGEHPVENSNETLNDLICGGEQITEMQYDRIFQPPGTDLHRLSANEFSDYIAKEGIKYILNPIKGLAFRETGTYPKGHLYCKRKGQKEHGCDWMDEDYELALMLRNIMTKEEYDNY